MATCSHGCEHGSGASRRHFLRQLGVAGAVAGMQSLFPGLNLAEATDRERERLANSAAVRQGKAQHLTILQTSDIHGHLLTHPEFFLENGEMVFRQAGGYARLATVFKQVRAENPGRVLAVDCGDCFQGSGIAALTRGAALVPLVNQLGYDLVLPGNWEVVYGIPRLREIAGQYRCPVVCSNMFRDETGEPLFHPYVVKEVGGIRIGFVGFNDPLVPRRQAPEYSRGSRFSVPGAVLPTLVDTLRYREGCQLVIALTHLGLAQQVDLSKQPECAGVDFILGGDTHERTYELIETGHAPVSEPGSFGSFVGRLDLVVQDGKLKDYTWQLLVVDAERYPEDPETRQLVEEIRAPYRSYLDHPVGETRTWLYRYSVLETPMDNLITDALREYTGADVALSNGFRFCAPIAPGPITNDHIWAMLPVDGEVKTGHVTGRQILQWLERELENVFAPDPTRRFGGWVVRFSGMTVRFTAGRPMGQRVDEVRIGGELLDERRTYTVAACARPGDPEDTLCRLRGVVNPSGAGLTAHEALKVYLARHRPVAPEIEGRVSATDLPAMVFSQLPGTHYEFR